MAGNTSFEMTGLRNSHASPTDGVGNASAYSSPKWSFDEDYYAGRECTVTIRDHVPDNSGSRVAPTQSSSYSRHRLPGAHRPGRVRNPAARSVVLPDDLLRRIWNRDAKSTRWINVVGWSASLTNELSKLHLGGHECLVQVGDSSQQVLGGPLRVGDEHEFIWLQTYVGFFGQQAPTSWSALKQTELRLVICLPTATSAGTIITNFVGRASLAEELSNICTNQILENHPLGQQSLLCVWILAFSILRTVAEQLDFALLFLDPIAEERPSVPSIDTLPSILAKANDLARIDKYLSSLEEFLGFFLSVRSMHQAEQHVSQPDDSIPCLSTRAKGRATFEGYRAQQKILYQQKLSRTYLRQWENLVQMVISYTTAQITERLDSGRPLAERIAAIGMILAGISGVISPLSLVTGYYGMNVQEFVAGGTTTLYEFWKIALPLVLLAVVVFAWLGMKTMYSGFR